MSRTLVHIQPMHFQCIVVELKSVDGVFEKYASALESSFDKELLARKRLEHSRGDVEAYVSAKSSLYEAEKEFR